MKRKILSSGHKHTTLFFTGWGMDEKPLENLSFNSNMILCYDYSDDAWDIPEISKQAEVRLVAWSLGVYAAELSAVASHVRISEAVAINGTTCPISDTSGIPEAIFDATTDGLTEATRQKFEKRMCGDAYELFASRHPLRDLNSLSDELRHIRQCVRQNHPIYPIRWNTAYISTHDYIFPAPNQTHAWQTAEEIKMVEGYHYPPRLFKALFEK